VQLQAAPARGQQPAASSTLRCCVTACRDMLEMLAQRGQRPLPALRRSSKVLRLGSESLEDEIGIFHVPSGMGPV
jgi:hypothetical protein